MKEFSSTNLKRYHLNFLNIKQHASQKYLFTWKNDFEGTRLLCFFLFYRADHSLNELLLQNKKYDGSW